MLAKDVIKKNRDNFERLNQYHQEWERSNHTSGLQCLDYEEFMKLYNMSDREIIERVLAKGVVIEDAEEYLANIGQ